MKIGSLVGCVFFAPFLGFDLVSTQSVAQPDSFWKFQDSGVESSLRGLCVVDNDKVWVSGSGGTVLKTVDSGENWINVSPKNVREVDFRDIHAFDQNHSIVMAAGQPAVFYRTDNGGSDWKKVYQCDDKDAFFDAIAFWNDRQGIAMSDPVDGRLLLVRTVNGGRSWKKIDRANLPRPLVGEGGFAASGTNLITVGKTCFLALGGAEPNSIHPNSRVLKSIDLGKTWEVTGGPMLRSSSAGIFSLAFSNENEGIAVGGNYLQPDQASENLMVTNNGGRTWLKAERSTLGGYRSCVAYVGANENQRAVAVGPTGTDWTDNGGMKWVSVSRQGFHAVAFSSDGLSGWACGSNGRIAVWKPNIASSPR